METNFNNYLESLKGKVIKVDRGGPESRVGKLLDVQSDYIILLTKEDGVLYYKTQHIKSITENVKESIGFDYEVADDFSYPTAENFTDLLGQLKYNWVHINRGGPEKIEGVLNDITNEVLVLVIDSEVIRLSSFHVRNISNRNKPEPIKKSKEEASEKEKEKKQEKEE
ncbi:hypothetical protein [Virgibacillus senegalensis]|uniref:hypothetical protein n=1 Tax=Virgibacillus senegalensis TaxID=1499679 RepID=UPI00069ECB90|nr:hypothetical protein [Virgibacillus senegalensis]